MTDTDRLKRLAEGAIKCRMSAYPSQRLRDARDLFQQERLDEAILALIAENERLGGLVKAFNNGMPPMTNKDVVEQRDEAVALLRASYNRADCSMWGTVTAFLARIDAAE